jgi:TonB family protein
MRTCLLLTVALATGPLSVAQHSDSSVQAPRPIPRDPMIHEDPTAKADAEKLNRPQRIKVASSAQATRLVFRVNPEYPEVAKRANISGRVRFKALIGTAGAVEALGLIAGHPMLIEPASKAIKQWRYHPTTINGEPTEVLTEIEVSFHLPLADGKKQGK